MNNPFTLLARLSKNADYRRVCNVLALYRPGEVIEADEIATLTGLDRDTTVFMLDDLMERAALLPYSPNGGGNVARLAAAA